MLAIALFAVVQYLLFDTLNKIKEQESIDIFQQGYTQGIVDSVSSLFEQTQNCEIAEISIGNNTRKIVDLSCVKAEDIP